MDRCGSPGNAMRSHRRGGDPLPRFLEKCDRPEGVGACWVWLCQKNGDGYGVFKVAGTYMRAYRYAYERMRGPVPDGLELDHKCRRRDCVNPFHLEAVTHAENIRRGNAGAHNRIKTHCRNGHAFSGDNLRLDRNGRRVCKACMRVHQQNWKRRQASEPTAA